MEQVTEGFIHLYKTMRLSEFMNDLGKWNVKLPNAKSSPDTKRSFDRTIMDKYLSVNIPIRHVYLQYDRDGTDLRIVFETTKCKILKHAPVLRKATVQLLNTGEVIELNYSGFVLGIQNRPMV